MCCSRVSFRELTLFIWTCKDKEVAAFVCTWHVDVGTYGHCSIWAFKLVIKINIKISLFTFQNKFDMCRSRTGPGSVCVSICVHTCIEEHFFLCIDWLKVVTTNDKLFVEVLKLYQLWRDLAPKKSSVNYSSWTLWIQTLSSPGIWSKNNMPFSGLSCP